MTHPKIISMKEHRYTILTGGTAWNSMVSAMNAVTQKVTYIHTISDNGGSSRKIINVFGGPSIGDIRSRLNRLATYVTPESKAVKTLLDHRLTKESSEDAFYEWKDILNGTSTLWTGISRLEKGFIHRFFELLEDERLKKESQNRADDNKFNFSDASLGNLYFTGMRLFFHGLKIPIAIFSNLSLIPDTIKVLPICETDSPISIAAKLANGSTIYGQNEISHPGEFVDKNFDQPLISPIEKIFYINQLNNPIEINADPDVLHDLSENRTLIYSMGSTFTSIIASLIAKGVGECIANKQNSKILILNGENDR